MLILSTFARTLLKGSLGALLALTLLLPNLASAVTQCDREAGHGLDPDGVVARVSRSTMDFDAAEKACRQAVADYPAHARSNYQLGRVLYYSGRGKGSLPFLQTAADAGYPQALFVLGFIQTIEDQAMAAPEKSFHLLFRLNRSDYGN